MRSTTLELRNFIRELQIQEAAAERLSGLEQSGRGCNTATTKDDPGGLSGVRGGLLGTAAGGPDRGVAGGRPISPPEGPQGRSQRKVTPLEGQDSAHMSIGGAGGGVEVVQGFSGRGGSSGGVTTLPPGGAARSFAHPTVSVALSVGAVGGPWHSEGGRGGMARFDVSSGGVLQDEVGEEDGGARDRNGAAMGGDCPSGEEEGVAGGDDCPDGAQGDGPKDRGSPDAGASGESFSLGRRGLNESTGKCLETAIDIKACNAPPLLPRPTESFPTRGAIQSSHTARDNPFPAAAALEGLSPIMRLTASPSPPHPHQSAEDLLCHSEAKGSPLVECLDPSKRRDAQLLVPGGTLPDAAASVRPTEAQDVRMIPREHLPSMSASFIEARLMRDLSDLTRRGEELELQWRAAQMRIEEALGGGGGWEGSNPSLSLQVVDEGIYGAAPEGSSGAHHVRGGGEGGGAAVVPGCSDAELEAMRRSCQMFRRCVDVLDLVMGKDD